MTEYSMGSFWSACIVSGITFLIANKKYYLDQGIAMLLLCYVSGLFAFFGYMALKKGGKDWSGQEILSGFLGAVLALWVPVILNLMF